MPVIPAPPPTPRSSRPVRSACGELPVVVRRMNPMSPTTPPTTARDRADVGPGLRAGLHVERQAIHVVGQQEGRGRRRLIALHDVRDFALEDPAAGDLARRPGLAAGGDLTRSACRDRRCAARRRRRLAAARLAAAPRVARPAAPAVAPPERRRKPRRRQRVYVELRSDDPGMRIESGHLRRPVLAGCEIPCRRVSSAKSRTSWRAISPRRPRLSCCPTT